MRLQLTPEPILRLWGRGRVSHLLWLTRGSDAQSTDIGYTNHLWSEDGLV